MSPDRHARTKIPIPDRPSPGLTTYDAKDPDTAFPPIEPLLPPEGAPNVVIILLDDVGFGAASTFGGPCRTPNADRLAAGGLKYNRFDTTALCAPTRAGVAFGPYPPWCSRRARWSRPSRGLREGDARVVAASARS